MRLAILKKYPNLGEDDVLSRSMGSGGEDVMLSPLARSRFPFSVECKSYNNFAVYKHYDQAKENAKDYIPLVIIKADRKAPLVVLDFEHFMELL